MKIQPLTFLLFVFITSFSIAGDEITLKAPISSATVYSQGAQIMRSAKYTVRPGINTLIIDGISRFIDPQSLQVSATGSVVLIDSKYTLFYPEPEPVSVDGLPLKIKRSIELLEDSIQNTSFELQDLQDEMDVYQAAKRVLANNGAIKGQGKVNDSIQLLQQAMDYYTSKTLELNKKIQRLTRLKTKKNEDYQAMNRRLKELKNFQHNANLEKKKNGPSHQIKITLSSKETVNGTVTISYMVSNAGWTPIYDLRADVNSENINLNYKAQVYQNTGIDWEDVRLNISTNNPYQNKTLPTLGPWYLAVNPRPDILQNQKSVEITYDKRGNPAMQAQRIQADDAEMSYDMNMSEAKMETSANFMQTVEHAISAEFKIDLPYTIPSDNEKHMVLIKNVNLKSEYKYYSIPKLDQSVYLVSEITDLMEHQLVGGKANIFFDGTYIGETFLNPAQMQDTMTLSLGKDPNLLIKRTLQKAECKEKTIGNNKERTMAYNLEVKSLKSTNVDIVIIDQIPITVNPNIEINATELSKGKLNEKTGSVEWKFKLKAKESKSFDMKYEVKHDKALNVYL